MLNNPLVRQPQQEYNVCSDTATRGVQANEEQRQRILWMAIRQALIIALGGIEDFLGMERSIEPRRRRVNG